MEIGMLVGKTKKADLARSLKDLKSYCQQALLEQQQRWEVVVAHQLPGYQRQLKEADRNLRLLNKQLKEYRLEGRLPELPVKFQREVDQLLSTRDRCRTDIAQLRDQVAMMLDPGSGITNKRYLGLVAYASKVEQQIKDLLSTTGAPSLATVIALALPYDRLRSLLGQKQHLLKLLEDPFSTLSGRRRYRRRQKRCAVLLSPLLELVTWQKTLQQELNHYYARYAEPERSVRLAKARGVLGSRVNRLLDIEQKLKEVAQQVRDQFELRHWAWSETADPYNFVISADFRSSFIRDQKQLARIALSKLDLLLERILVDLDSSTIVT